MLATVQNVPGIVPGTRSDPLCSERSCYMYLDLGYRDCHNTTMEYFDVTFGTYGLRQNKGHSPCFAFGGDTYRSPRSPRSARIARTARTGD